MEHVVGGTYKMWTSEGEIIGTFVSQKNKMLKFFPWNSVAEPNQEQKNPLIINEDTITKEHRLT